MIIMTLERPQNKAQLDEFVERAINEYKLSSIREMSEIADVSVERVVEVIQELLNNNRIDGRLDLENERFFSSKVDVSTAPSIKNSTNARIIQPDNKYGKYAILSGAALMVIDELIPTFTINSISSADIKGILLLVGLGLIFGGLYYIGQRGTKIVSE